MNKIDISSTTLEKGLELAKDFLNKLVSPGLEETGLLIRDKLMFWRFKNQVRMINKAKIFCEENGISPKHIPIKLLSPIMEYSGLEDNDELLDRWAILLSNMVDSDQNIENHVFPYLLSQISINEFKSLEGAANVKREHVIKTTFELEAFLLVRDQSIQDLIIAIEENKTKEAALYVNIGEKYKEANSLRNERLALEYELREINLKEGKLRHSISLPQVIITEALKDFEISNLVRLGVIREQIQPYAYVARHSVRMDPLDNYIELKDVPVEINYDEEIYYLTELGELFIEVCTEKQKKI